MVSAYIGAALLYITKAETDVRIMRDKDLSQSVDSPLAFAKISESRERLRARASSNLEVARFKLDRAQARLAEVTPREERLPIPNDESKTVSQSEQSALRGAPVFGRCLLPDPGARIQAMDAWAVHGVVASSWSGYVIMEP